MPFTVPSMVLTVNIYRSGGGPPSVPDVISAGNLSVGRRLSNITYHDAVSLLDFHAFTYLLLPAGTDVRDAFCASGADGVECPAGSGRWYIVYYVDDVGKGYANEYRMATMAKSGLWPQPIP